MEVTEETKMRWTLLCSLLQKPVVIPFPSWSIADEKKKSSVITRVVSGLSILFAFILIVYIGHLPILALVALLQVRVWVSRWRCRSECSTSFSESATSMLLRRKFLISAFFTGWSSRQPCLLCLVRIVLSSWCAIFHEWRWWSATTRIGCLLAFHALAGFLWFSTFVTLWSLSWVWRRDSTNTRLARLLGLCLRLSLWCIRCVLSSLWLLKVWMKREGWVVHFLGLVWFVLPVMTVAWNDTMAYFCGMKWGRKWVWWNFENLNFEIHSFLISRFINKPLTSLSPNKSWEGFIFGGCCTFIIGWIMTWMFNVGEMNSDHHHHHHHVYWWIDTSLVLSFRSTQLPCS